jgi:hypothetical protein
MTIKFQKEEIDELKRKVWEKSKVPHTLDLLSILNNLSRELEYPITSLKDFEKNIDKEKIALDKRMLIISNLESLIPVHYFPINDSKDFEYKCSQLYNEIVKESYYYTETYEEPYIRKVISYENAPPPFPERLKRIRPRPREPGAEIENI